ncbi:MAG: hypothetical protein K0S65_5153 [Labilithrix sp.]|nr:hypothetical protein [Labilithrix sp.]
MRGRTVIGLLFCCAGSAKPRPGNEGGTTSDAGIDPPRTDADAGSESGAQVGCTGLIPTPQFCEDFDDEPLSGGWDLLQRQGGTLEFDPLAYSPPQSGRVNLVSAPECSYVRFERSFSGIGKKRVEVRIRMRPRSPWNGQFSPLVLHLSECALLLYVGGDGDAIRETAVNIQSGDPLGNDVRQLVGVPHLDEWTDVWMTAVPGGTGAELTFTFRHPDGTVSETTIGAPQCKLDGDLFIGAGYHCNSGSSETRYDDVRVYWE